jgi:hypothetical protein
MLHSVANNLDKVTLKPGPLKEFFEAGSGEKSDNQLEGLTVIRLPKVPNSILTAYDG